MQHAHLGSVSAHDEKKVWFSVRIRMLVFESNKFFTNGLWEPRIYHRDNSYSTSD